MLQKLGSTFGSQQYVQAKRDFVLAVGNGAPFNVMAGDNLGKAGDLLARGTGVPTNYKTIILSTKDHYGQYFNFALLVEALLRGSGARFSFNNYVSLTDARSGVIKYTTKFVEKLGITPPRAAAPTPQLPNPPAPAPPTQNEQPPTVPPPTPTPTNLRPPIPGTRDIVLDRTLFEWHTGDNPNSSGRWKFDADDDLKPIRQQYPFGHRTTSPRRWRAAAISVAQKCIRCCPPQCSILKASNRCVGIRNSPM